MIARLARAASCRARHGLTSMLPRLGAAILISALVVVPPALGNLAAFRAPHLWVILIYGVLASLLQPGYNPVTITSRPRDRGTGAQIIWSVYLVMIGAVAEYAYWRYPGGAGWGIGAAIALGVMLLGLIIRTWAVATLGRLFTMHIAVHDGHAVIRSGPYRFVRHPSYLGAYLMYLGVAAFLAAWDAVAAGAIVMAFAFVRRIRVEEELLIGELGGEYETYRSEVKAFIPGIW